MWNFLQILEKRGYQMQLRGVVAVKGKGDMETYYVMGRKAGHAPGFVRQPSTYSSLATVVYGMLQARRRQTIKKSATSEWHLRLMNELTVISSTCKIQLDCQYTFWIKILFCSVLGWHWVPLYQLYQCGGTVLGLQPAVPAVSVWWDNLLGLQPAVPAPDDRQAWKTGAMINGSGKLKYSLWKRPDWMPLLSITNPTWPALVPYLIQLKWPAI